MFCNSKYSNIFFILLCNLIIYSIKPFTLLDEIDCSLDVYVIEKLSSYLKKRSKEGYQIIIITHHPFMYYNVKSLLCTYNYCNTSEIIQYN